MQKKCKKKSLTIESQLLGMRKLSVRKKRKWKWAVNDCSSNLADCDEDEHEGEEDEVVQGGGVGHLGEVGAGLQAQERHRQDSGHA